MAYMHNDSFEILQGSNIDNYLDEYFDVDDLIALPIQTLNRRGYKTQFCCSGHPFESVSELFSELEMTIEHCPIIGVYKIEEATNPTDPKYKHRLLVRNPPDRSSYITFESGTILPSLPCGFEKKETEVANPNKTTCSVEGGKMAAEKTEKAISINRNYDEDTSVYDYLIELVSAMRELNEWALSLPDISKRT